MSWFEVILLAVVEGLTEFLPISSTGHMVLVSHFVQIQQSDFLKAFEVIIQFGAILSVVLYYWRRFVSGRDLYIKLAIAFLPTGIIGFLLKKKVDMWLESPILVAVSLLIGGVILVWSDRFFSKSTGKNADELTVKELASIGVIQSISMVPGVSRSAATILGGLSMGLSRKAAAEFSFLLAVPTMLVATLYKLVKISDTLNSSGLSQILVGSIIAFIVALGTVHFLIHTVERFGFRYFGYYRIGLGLGLLILLLK
ncbi:MAG TPA: undecaprenyl-diphosphate phosphatase [Pseudobdellovibrionaceae bacterium]|nr:undecaprenyl-diphosphate phosphatase [Pseudobdellovibrionaceae bacterium]